MRRHGSPSLVMASLFQRIPSSALITNAKRWSRCCQEQECSVSHRLKAVHSTCPGQGSFQKEPEQNPSVEKTRLSGGLKQPALGGPFDFQHCEESDVQKAVAWFAE